MADLQAVSPWIPQFTPSAAASEVKAPPKRCPSPFSGQQLRAKDLIPVNLRREAPSGEASGSGPVRFICPVTQKTITNQKVILIKSTGTLMLESSAQQLAYPSMTCPITGQAFRQKDIIELSRSASGFAASGEVQAKKYRPNIN